MIAWGPGISTKMDNTNCRGNSRRTKNLSLSSFSIFAHVLGHTGVPVCVLHVCICSCRLSPAYWISNDSESNGLTSCCRAKTPAHRSSFVFLQWKNEEEGRDVSLKCCCLNERKEGISMVVQWSRLHASTAGDTGSIPGQGIKILHAMQSGHN